MKILIKYYNKWGQLQQAPLQISSKGQVNDLKKSIEQVASIELEKQIITVINNNSKVQLDQNNRYLTDFEITEKTTIFVQSIDDSFSGESFCSSFQLEEQKCTLLEEESSCFIEHQNQSNISQNPFNYKIDSNNSQYQQFFEAIKDNQLEKAKRLIQPGMINDTSKHNWSALHLAVFHGYDKIFLWLMSEGGDVNLESRDGWDCLSLAIWQKNTTIITLLIGQQNLDINRRTKHGTALHIAAQVDDASILQILLTHPKINLNVLDEQFKRPVDIAGDETKPILSWEMSKLDVNLLESFRSSVSNFIRFSNLSNNSFFVNCPPRPPIIKGLVYKVNSLKLSTRQRYLIADPESGVIAFFKKVSDSPMNPYLLLSLETIDDVRLSKNKWFQMDEFYYIEVQCQKIKVYIALHYKPAARQWYESLRNCVGYAKYMDCKIKNYMELPKKLEKNIVQLMMERSNEEIIITDENILDQKSHLKKQQEQVKQKYQQSLVSVTERSNQEDDSKDQKEQSDTCLKLKDFDILDHVGRGTFGNVYKALLKSTGRIYALKQQDKQKLIDQNHLKYVKGELNILKQLHHPFLVNLHFAFQTHHYLYLALDFCERGDLSKFMSRGVVLDEFTAKFLISQIILSLEYLHSKNIIYRDLKPENIIVEDDGFIKLIDFGLSKEIKSQDFIARSFCGSPAYLSPEIIAGQGTTKATDIYSVGTILYEMLTGYPPFFCNELKQLLHNIRFLEKLQLLPNLSKSASNLLHKLLEKNPEARLGAKNISILKKHIFFAEINWDKLLQKKYIAPKMKPRTITEKKQVYNIDAIVFDKDYDDDNCTKLSKIPDWNFVQ